jgi:hypothetical protein
MMNLGIEVPTLTAEPSRALVLRYRVAVVGTRVTAWGRLS